MFTKAKSIIRYSTAITCFLFLSVNLAFAADLELVSKNVSGQTTTIKIKVPDPYVASLFKKLDIYLSATDGSGELGKGTGGPVETDFTYSESISGLSSSKIYNIKILETFDNGDTRIAPDNLGTVKVGMTSSNKDPITSIKAVVSSTTAKISVTFDPSLSSEKIDSVSAVVKGNVVGMGGGGYVFELGNFNPTVSKTHTFDEVTNLLPNTTYTVTVTAKSNGVTKYTQTKALTTKASTGTNTNTNTNNTNTSNTNNSNTNADAGTQNNKGADAVTNTQPGGLVGCEGASCSFQDVLEVIKKGYSFVIKLIFPIAAIIIAYTGFLFITSGGNEEVRGKAKYILKKAILGIILILCAGLIVGLLYKAFGVKSCYNWIGKEIKDCTTQASQHNTRVV